MKADLRAQVEEAFLYLASCYSWFRPADSDIAIAVWCDALEDVNPESIYPAVKHWCKHNSKEPCAADILKIIVSASRQKRQPLVHVAWDELVRAAEEGLTWERVEQRFRKYPRVLMAARSVSWKRIRHSDALTELPFVRRDFIAAYADIQQEAKDMQQFTDQEKELFQKIAAAKPKKELIQ